jgi:CHAT domain-containing protein/tetratricopeptide (TPR) repeat protein
MTPLRAVTLLLVLAGCAHRDNEPLRASSLLVLGDSQYARGAFDSAGATYTRALDEPGTRGSPNEARLLANLAMVAYRQDEYATARRLGDSALALKRRYNMGSKEIAESRNGLGLIAWNEGRLADATSEFEQAMAEYTAANDDLGVAKASNNLGLIVLEYGRFADAKRRFEATRETARRIREPRIEGRATTNLAMLELWFGDPRATVSLVADARRLSAQAHDAVNEENALVQLALGLAALGEPGRAIATVDSALAIARRHELREEEAEDLVVSAGLYASAGDVDRALHAYAAARKLYESLELPVEVATLERQEAVLRASRGAVARAREGLQGALEIHRKNDSRFEAFRDILALARLETDAKATDAAGRWLDEIDRDLTDLDGSYVRVALALARARWHDARGDATAVLRTLGDISADLAIADTHSQLEGDWLRTRSFAARHQADSAVASAMRAAQTIERTGSGFSSLTLRVGYVAEQHQILTDIVLTLLRAGVTDEAFRIAESGRGRALRAQLARVRGTISGVAGSTRAEALAERERLLREIDALVARLTESQQLPRSERGAEWPQTNTELARRIREARTSYEALVLRQSESGSDQRRQALMAMPTVSVSMIQRVIAPSEAVIEYYPTRDTLVVFAITRDTVRALRIPVGSENIEHRVRLVRGLLNGSSRPEASRPALEGLHALLVEPLQRAGGLADVRRIVLVPHGILTYLPFAALRNARTGRALVEDFVLERLPAATMLPGLRQTVPTQAAQRRTAVFTPFPDRLPATTVEADVLSRMTPNVRVYRGAAATEARLRQALAERGRVHVASHATFNEVNPMFSGVLLARGHGDSRDDGRLEMHEVLDLALRSTIVFLSGCETALGAARTTTFARVEDATTLGDAFLLSGARGVVATLWRIDDEGAADFADRFYRQLGRHDPAEALALAQRELLAEKRWANPYYWAPYTLTGDGVAVE